MGAEISFKGGLELTVIAMIIVFILLYAISLILESFRYIFKETKENHPKEVKNITNDKPTLPISKTNITFADLEKDPDMSVAAMVATIDASNQKKDSTFKITSIREL